MFLSAPDPLAMLSSLAEQGQGWRKHIRRTHILIRALDLITDPHAVPELPFCFWNIGETGKNISQQCDPDTAQSTGSVLQQVPAYCSLFQNSSSQKKRRTELRWEVSQGSQGAGMLLKSCALGSSSYLHVLSVVP